MDLNKPKELGQMLQQLGLEVDILVNNGGTSMREEFINLDFDVCETMMNTNLLAHIAATKVLLPHMLAKRCGHIVNIVSGSGVMGMPVRTLYCASKFGLSGFGKALRAEVAHTGVQVLQVYPGYVQTNISLNAMTGSGEKFGKVDSNIKEGMSVEACCEQIVKAIGLGYTEMMIGPLAIQVLPYLAVVTPLVNMVTTRLYTKQMQTKEKAE
jgi:dehydrogenase/reductase SDR family protein 7B